ncbi:MAG: ammonia-forming cytochrome c nitrite reductase subunit c552 [Verrucomicrobiae bacterium]|nr:ammonia-forming cytochrome c nitrite reductase subunit c552 [Verrucomicrobiae bacterium]
MSRSQPADSFGLEATPAARILVMGAMLIGGLLAVTVVVSVSAAAKKEKALARLALELPLAREDAGYVSSNACQSCHPGEHASFHKTYHRTMTQPALPDTVAGSFDGTSVMSDGLEYRVFRKAEEFWAEMPDPEEMMYVVQGGKPLPLDKIPRVERRVVMTTGSHHYQTYWASGADKYGNLLQTLPLIYLIKEQRWIPREEAFMKAPHDRGRMITQWNNHCINCHSTGGNPGLQKTTREGGFKTAAGELGISCEACHGPGEEHIRVNRNPLRRYGLHGGSQEDSTMVNPAKLDHKRGSQVCGQCHGVYIRTDAHGMKFAEEGEPYRPGDDLNETRYYIRYPQRDATPIEREEFAKNPAFFAERWWEDGTVMAGGREYSGMSVSACYTRGEMSCFSCHSMHDSDPADQLKKGGATNGACVECHGQPEYTTEVSRHTHHAVGSSGSECMNCHMPHTAYALFSAIRNHQIESPDLDASAHLGVPNACNLCHLNKTLEWTAEAMHERYGTPKVELNEEQREVSAALLWMLKGHAAQRVIAAWHTGWKPAQDASGSDWLAPFQAQLLDDPYGVVRYVAVENLKALSGFEDFDFDFIGPENERREKIGEAIAQWREQGRGGEGSGRSELLLNDDGTVDEARLRQLLSERDNRPVNIKE